MSYGMIAMAAVSLTGMAVNASQGNKNRKLAEGQYEDQKLLQQASQKKLDAQKAEYKRMDFKNLKILFKSNQV